MKIRSSSVSSRVLTAWDISAMTFRDSMNTHILWCNRWWRNFQWRNVVRWLLFTVIQLSTLLLWWVRSLGRKWSRWWLDQRISFLFGIMIVVFTGRGTSPLMLITRKAIGIWEDCFGRFVNFTFPSIYLILHHREARLITRSCKNLLSRLATCSIMMVYLVQVSIRWWMSSR